MRQAFEGTALVEGTETPDGRLVMQRAVRFTDRPVGLYDVRFAGDPYPNMVGVVQRVWRSGADIRISGEWFGEPVDPGTNIPCGADLLNMKYRDSDDLLVIDYGELYAVALNNHPCWPQAFITVT
jgi:hypothetical protein